MLLYLICLLAAEAAGTQHLPLVDLNVKDAKGIGLTVDNHIFLQHTGSDQWADCDYAPQDDCHIATIPEVMQNGKRQEDLTQRIDNVCGFVSTRYNTIFNTLFNTSLEIPESERELTSMITDMYHTYLAYNPSNVAKSRIITVCNTNKGLRVFPYTIPFLFVAGSQNKRSPGPSETFAKEYNAERVNALHARYCLTQYEGKDSETDQALLLTLLEPHNIDLWIQNLQQQLEAKPDLAVHSIVGIVVDTVSWFDPCSYCAALIKREIQMKIIKNFITTRLRERSAETNFHVEDAFKMCFHFMTFQPAGARNRTGGGFFAQLKGQPVSCYKEY